jgi:hypothetical protein
MEGQADVSRTRRDRLAGADEIRRCRITRRPGSTNLVTAKLNSEVTLFWPALAGEIA